MPNVTAGAAPTLTNTLTNVFIYSNMGSIFSAIGRGINAIISAIAGLIMAIVSAITTVIVTIFDVIVDILFPTAVVRERQEVVEAVGEQEEQALAVQQPTKLPVFKWTHHYAY
ncbi:hypothetical protein B0H10DRAFT_2208304 [Mycena sp. CBHHK59/15]|nr:hypothetical protein B0H10DRAFT_2208304 [Mycena sp. CBHHK59/15]